MREQERENEKGETDTHRETERKIGTEMKAAKEDRQ